MKTEDHEADKAYPNDHNDTAGWFKAAMSDPRIADRDIGDITPERLQQLAALIELTDMAIKENSKIPPFDQTKQEIDKFAADMEFSARKLVDWANY